MKELTIVRLGHPALRKKSTTVTNKDMLADDFQEFLDKLAAICIDNDGVGIAAPQVGINKRIIVVNVDPTNKRYSGKKPFPLTIIINPKIESKSRIIKEDWEGDLSCGLRALVPRPDRCIVTGLDRHRKPVKFTLTDDFHARVFQHEIDHLNGVFLLDRVKRKETISEVAEWKKYWKDSPID